MAIDIEAHATRCDGWWAVSCPDIPGLFTQVRRLDQIEDMVRDAAHMMGVEVASVQVVPELDEDARMMLDELEATRREVEERQNALSSLTRNLVGMFKNEGLTLRDIASIVGLSPQRVSVLLRKG